MDNRVHPTMHILAKFGDAITLDAQSAVAQNYRDAAAHLHDCEGCRVIVQDFKNQNQADPVGPELQAIIDEYRTKRAQQLPKE